MFLIASPSNGNSVIEIKRERDRVKERRRGNSASITIVCMIRFGIVMARRLTSIEPKQNIYLASRTNAISHHYSPLLVFGCVAGAIWCQAWTELAAHTHTRRVRCYFDFSYQFFSTCSRCQVRQNIFTTRMRISFTCSTVDRFVSRFGCLVWIMRRESFLILVTTSTPHRWPSIFLSDNPIDFLNFVIIHPMTKAEWNGRHSKQRIEKTKKDETRKTIKSNDWTIFVAFSIETRRICRSSTTVARNFTFFRQFSSVTAKAVNSRRTSERRNM